MLAPGDIHLRLLPYIWMLLSSACFAAMSSLAHAAGRTCDWQVVAIARTGLALVFAAGLAFGAKRQFVFFRPAILWTRSIAGSVSLVCGFFAITHMPVADTLALTNMYPLWVAVLSWPMLGTLPRRDVWIAILCGLGGVALIQQPQLATGNYVWTAAVLASFTSAIALMGLHKLRDIDPRAVVVHFSGVSLLFCVLSLFVFPHNTSVMSKFDAETLLTLLGVGVMATGGQLLLTLSFTHGDPAKVSVVGLSQVAFGMILDVLFWGRTFSSATVAGILLVVLPTAWVMRRRR
jgi:drug/metabolite transporter (DMT)-like permease